MGSPFIFNGVYSKNLLNALRLGGLAADPASPAAGDFYYNTTTNQFKYYSGAAWVIVAGSTPIVARYRSATATVTGTDSNISYTTSDFDSNSAYSAPTFTVPAGQSGYYTINAQVSVSATYVAGNVSAISVYVNGTQQVERQLQAYSGATTLVVDVNTLLNLNAGDLVTFRVRSSGTTPTITVSSVDNYFSLAKVGATSSSIIGNWTSYIPTIIQGFGVTTNLSCYWRQVGQNYEVMATFTTGTMTGSEAQISLPSGTTSSILPATPGGAGTAPVVGTFIRNGTTGAFDSVVLAEPGNTYVTFGISNGSSGGLTKVIGTALAGNSEAVSLRFSVPITGL